MSLANLRRLPHNRTWLVGLFFVGLILPVSLPQLPSLRDQERDSGIFAYTARVIVEGGMPYRDAWDNKPPGVYYIDALAFLIFGFNRWALWLVELAFTITTAAIFFTFLRSLIRQTKLALVGVGIFILLNRNPALVGDGNFTESYALLPQVLCLAAGYQFLREPRARWAVLLGMSAGLAFLIKQTTVGVALTFIPAVLLTRHTVLQVPDRWRLLSLMIAGGLLPLLASAGYLHINGVLDDAIDATLISPMYLHDWVSHEQLSLWEKLYGGLTTGTFTFVFLPLMPFFLIGMVWALASIFRSDERTTTSRNNHTLLVWLVLTFAVDIFLTNLTGRAYFHYYITPTLSLAVLTIMELGALNQLKNRRLWYRLAWMTFVLYLGTVNLSYVTAIAEKLDDAEGELIGESIEDSLAVYVEQHTHPEDEIWVWGASSDIYFQSERESATQFHYAYPLIVPDYTQTEHITDLIADLKQRQPVMIVDRAVTDGNRVPPLNLFYRVKWWAQGGRRDTEDLQPIYDFVSEHCRITNYINGAVIFRCTY